MSKDPGRILIVDDDDDILVSARLVLKKHFNFVNTANDPHHITRLLAKEPYDVVLLDMNFTAGFTTGKEGMRWLKKIRKLSPATQVVLMTAYGDIPMAVHAMKEGAADFVAKPWDNEQMISALKAAGKTAREEFLEQSPEKSSTSDQLIGESQPMLRVLSMVQKVARTDANVLILGENGTGKEVIARNLHQQSGRAAGPFIHVDLGAVPESLFESELFGHRKGAFTGAHEDRIGRFEAAKGGTLFLDEIGNLSLPMQAKLLTVLQSRKVTRLGNPTSIDIDIRLICATNMPLMEMVADQSFRQDLIYRINTVEITLPPLRERGDDIKTLALYFLQKYARKYHREGLKLSTESFKKLKAYHWPGNVRELQHTLERAVIMADDEELRPDDFSLSEPTFAEASLQEEESSFKLEEMEKRAIIRAIEKHQGNMSRAAKELGLGRTTLYRKMSKYGL